MKKAVVCQNQSPNKNVFLLWLPSFFLNVFILSSLMSTEATYTRASQSKNAFLQACQLFAKKKCVAFGKGSVVGPQREARLHFSLCAPHFWLFHNPSYHVFFLPSLPLSQVQRIHPCVFLGPQRSNFLHLKLVSNSSIIIKRFVHLLTFFFFF